MEKEFIVKLSSELFKSKTDIESELLKGNKTNEKLYNLILKAIQFLNIKNQRFLWLKNFRRNF